MNFGARLSKAASCPETDDFCAASVQWYTLPPRFIPPSADPTQRAICCRIFAPALPNYPAASVRDYCSGAYTQVFVVGDEGLDLSFEIARQVKFSSRIRLSSHFARSTYHASGAGYS